MTLKPKHYHPNGREELRQKKSKMQAGAVGDTKQRGSEVIWHKVIISEGDNIVIGK